MTSGWKERQRSLRESLKTMLKRDRTPCKNELTVGSGILRRQDPSLALLSNFSSLSLLPDFQSSRFDIDQCSVSIPDHHGNTSVSVYANDLSRVSLLPKMSLTEFREDVRESHVYQNQLHQLAQTCSVANMYKSGASRQASLASIDTQYTDKPTLRLQPSRRVLEPPPEQTTAYPQIYGLTSSTTQKSSISPAEGRCTPKRKSSSINRLKTPLRGSPVIQPRPADSVSYRQVNSVDHFASFCVLDTWTPGCPVTATSTDLRYIFDIGEPFCLNSQTLEGASMDTVTGVDADGNEITHLVLYSPLVNPSSGRSRFVLASLIDVTSFIQDLVSLPELDMTDGESAIEEDIQTPPKWPEMRIPSYKLSAESLLGGCSLPEKRIVSPSLHETNDIWLDIATEEIFRTSSCRSSGGSTTPRTRRTSCSTVSDDMLDQFVFDLLELYSDFILLGKSPLDENSYEICNVSPRIFASREYIEGHLSHTSQQDKAELEENLMYDKPFSAGVRWGSKGVSKRLFCIPLFGRYSLTWVCFLVEPHRTKGLPSW